MQIKLFSVVVKKTADEVIDPTIYKFPGTSELNFSPNIDNSKVTYENKVLKYALPKAPYFAYAEYEINFKSAFSFSYYLNYEMIF